MKKTTNLFFVSLAGKLLRTNKAKKYPTVDASAIALADLDLYVGIYASEDLKMKITVTKNDLGNSLIAQSANKSSFPLNPVNRNVFNGSSQDLVMEFLPENNKFALVQCGGCYPFIKEC